ncbi:hypothetical protein DXV76_09180 [Rhodobacteraceae bacterium CCMM004]|nr:hypothetical protein DXV76_09180 [Rhodobacteraceae bacterium CCMM004]
MSSRQDMSIEMRRFLAKIGKDIVPHLELNGLPEREQSTKALTALALAKLAGMPIESAKKYVVDGAGDSGIDGVFFNEVTRTLYFIQSKLRENQRRSIDQSDALKTTNGIRKLLRGDIDNFSGALKKIYPEVRGALNDINVKIVIIVACSSTAELGTAAADELESFCQENNQIDDVFSFRYASFNELYQAAKLFSPNQDIDVRFTISPFGYIEEPHKSVFGMISGSQIADWVNNFGDRLFEQNVRYSLSRSSVNDEILETIKNKPEAFWYFNNGITAIAADIKVSASDTTEKTVLASSMSIVNGAQTAGMISRARTEGLSVDSIRVQMRVVSLSSASPGFDEEITRANNTQNSLTALDFVSLDSQQDLLRSQLAALGHRYVFRRGGEGGEDLPVIQVKDAAVALACAHSINLTAQAKRYVSGLWNNINSTTYKSIFGSATTAERVLFCWSVLQFTERALKARKNDLSEAHSLLLTHAEKFILHMIFIRLGKDKVFSETATYGQLTAILAELPDAYDGLPDKTYPAADFKSVGFLERMKKSILERLDD